MVEAGAIGILGYAETAGGIALGVGVDDQDFEIVRCQRGGEVDGGCRFADATFLVCDCKYPAQAAILTRSLTRLKLEFHVKHRASRFT